MEDAYEKISSWLQEYNYFRPHSSLNELTPAEAVEQYEYEMQASKYLPAAPNDVPIFFASKEQLPATSEKISDHH